MYTEEQFSMMVSANLMKQANVLVEKMKDLQSITFAEEVKVLFIVGHMSGTTLSVDVTTREDMFNEIDHDEVVSGFAGSLEWVAEFVFDEWDSEESFAFYEENELEDTAIAEIAGWIQYCFDQTKEKALQLPIYFVIHDEDYALHLKNGEWVDPEEVEL